MDKTRNKQGLPLTLEEKIARRNELNRIQRFKLKEEAVAYMGGKCSICGNTYHSSAYDFHHLDPSEKDVDPGSLLRRPREILYAELAKCVLLCANCHRIHHWKEANTSTDWNLVPVDTTLIEYRGTKLTYKEWSQRTGLKAETIRARLKDYGWTVEQALTIPARYRRHTNAK